MAALEDLKPNASIRGVLPSSVVTVVNVQWYGSDDQCLRRFTDAARLVGADLAQWPSLPSPWSDVRIDLAPLLPFWRSVCERYNRDIHDGQLDLLRDSNAPDVIFSEFIHWRLWPVVVSEHECVRNVLRAVGSLPSRDRLAASNALVAFIADLEFHAAMRPSEPSYLPWPPVDGDRGRHGKLLL